MILLKLIDAQIDMRIVNCSKISFAISAFIYKIYYALMESAQLLHL
jgi:hypothetical protein